MSMGGVTDSRGLGAAGWLDAEAEVVAVGVDSVDWAGVVDGVGTTPLTQPAERLTMIPTARTMREMDMAVDSDARGGVS